MALLLESRPPPLMVFVASPGRCGTKFLAELFAAAGARADHEAKPTLANAALAARLAGSPRPEDAAAKAAAIRGIADDLAAAAAVGGIVDAVAGGGGGRAVYLDANHLFVTYPDVVEAAIAAAGDIEAAAVVVRRDLISLVASRCALGHLGGTRKCGWIWDPAPATATAASGRAAQVEALVRYHVDVERRSSKVAAEWRRAGRVVVEVRAEDLWTEAGATALLAAFGLAPSAAVSACVARGPTHRRLAEKRIYEAGAPPRGEIAALVDGCLGCLSGDAAAWAPAALPARAAALCVSEAFLEPPASMLFPDTSPGWD